MIIQRMTIKNGVLYTERDNKFKISPVREYKGFNITLKNLKSQRVKRWLALGYELTEKEIIIRLPDNKIKRYQNNEWTVVHTSIHYF